MPSVERLGKRREIVDYVEGQSPTGVRVKHAAKVETKRFAGRKYDLWDVETTDGKWWVITNHTNLYSKDQFPDSDIAFTFHLGLMERIIERQQLHEPRASARERDRLAGAWRRWQQASEALTEADEAEAFQAVGMRCREALLTFAREAAGPEWVPAGAKAPQLGNFVAWSRLIANAVATNRLRALLSGMAELTWDYAQSVTHNKDATMVDGITVVAATADVLGLYGYALVRHERGVPNRCPRCGSYRLEAEYRPELRAEDPYLTFCASCDWEDVPPTGEAAPPDQSD